MIRRGRTRWWTAAGALVVGWLASFVVASCTTGDAADRARRASEVYVAVLDVVLDDIEPASDGTGEGAASSAPASGSTERSATSTVTSTTPSTASTGSPATSAPAADGTSRTTRAAKEGKHDRLPLLFVSPLEEGQPFNLEVQAAVIERLADRALVRFVDTRRQAVDAKVEDQPTLDDGTLVRLGRVPQDGDVVQVDAERYQRTDDWEAMRFVVRVEVSGWHATLVERKPRPPDR